MANSEPAARRSENGIDLDGVVDAVLFDMDGVVTDTARAHAAAWKRLFDEYLQARAGARDEAFQPFDPDRDYREYVDGKPRYEGVESFLASRGIGLPRGDEDDGPEAETVCGLGNRKNAYFRAWLAHNGVDTFSDAIAFIEALRRAGIATAVFTSSRNADAVLRNAGVHELFDAKVDGNDTAAMGLPGKPDPAILHEAASRLGVAADRAAVVEDSTAGVEAGAAGGFALVIGVDRAGYPALLEKHGADRIVRDMRELLKDPQSERAGSITTADLPSVWTGLEEIGSRFEKSKPALFLDYDGTLTPIVEDYSKAILSEEVRATLAELARHYTVAIVSGRDLANLRELVRLDPLFYAGSHGYDVAGPQGWGETRQQGTEFLPLLDAAERELRERLAPFEGAAVERKRFAIAVHYRRSKEEDVGRIEQALDDVLSRYPRLRKGHGKKVFQVQPKADWDKGRAVDWLLERLGLGRPNVLPVYVGDDLTDEDAFRALRNGGLGIVVRDGNARATRARYALEGPEDVNAFLQWLVELAEKDVS